MGVVFRGVACEGPVDGVPIAADRETVTVRVTASGRLFFCVPTSADEARFGPVVETVVYRWRWGVWMPDEPEPAGVDC